MAYGLKRIETEIPNNVTELATFVNNGYFVEDSIFHQHFSPVNDFFAALSPIECTLISVIRNPYDMFTSLYHYVQNFAQNYINVNSPACKIIGKPIDHPDVLDFLSNEFTQNLDLTHAWLQSGKSHIVRYEDMHSDTFTTIKALVNKIEPLPDERIVQAITASDAQSMRQQGKWLKKHIRSGKVGDWKNHLSSSHLEIFRTKYGDLVNNLGYEVIERSVT